MTVTAKRVIPASQTAHLKPWQPGQSGNPAGRPKGARSKLSELTLNLLLKNFEEHGETTIEEVRKKRPEAYLAAVVSLLPKQQEKIESPFSDLTNEELELLEQFLKSTRAHTAPQQIDATAQDLTRAAGNTNTNSNSNKDNAA